MRASRADWLRAGLGLLRRDGEAALTVERLCAELGLSKGSFYHHFHGLDDFSGALLSTWSEAQTEWPLAQAARADGVDAQLRLLGETVRGLDHALDVAVRVWSLHCPVVRAQVQAVDRRRLSALGGLLRSLGHPEPERRAWRVYAGLLGAQLLGEVERWFEAEVATLEWGP